MSANEIIGGLQQLIERAHEKKLMIFGGTLTPFEGTTFPGYHTPAGELKRQSVNAWIRTKANFDAVIDFDQAVRDPSHPTRLLPAYDCGDHLHPDDTGFAPPRPGSFVVPPLESNTTSTAILRIMIIMLNNV